MNTSPETGDNPTQPSKPQPTPLLSVRTKGGVAGWSQVLGFLAAFTAVIYIGLFLGVIAILLALISILRRRWGREAFDGLMGGTIALVFIFGIGAPIQNRANDQARRIYCSNNVAIIQELVNKYISEHNAVPSQQELMKQSSKTWRCPFNRNLDVGYFYLPPAVDAPDTTLMVCDYFANHKGKGRSVACLGNLNERPGWRTEQEFQQELLRPENHAFAEALRQSPLEQRR